MHPTIHKTSQAAMLGLSVALAAGTPAEIPPVRTAAESINAFAFDLYEALTRENPDRNLFFSPGSIAGALTMTFEGARGETAVQMGTVLRFPAGLRQPNDDARPWDTAAVHQAMGELFRQIAPDDSSEAGAILARITTLEREREELLRAIGLARNERVYPHELITRDYELVRELNQLRQGIDQYVLRIASALWCAEAFPFRREFLETLDDAYGAAAHATDFGDAEAARNRINRWVEANTNDRIRNLIAPGMVTPATILVLTNAIYFKGKWQDEFDASLTVEAPFILGDGRASTAMMMSAPKIKARYADITPDGIFNEPIFEGDRPVYHVAPNPDGFQILALPYRGGALSMIVLLPNQPDDLAALECQLTPGNLAAWLDGMKPREVNVFLPRFRMETTYSLANTLKDMGMPAAFQPGGFTGISDSAAGGLSISEVAHKAFIDVDETGTEAAAATAVMMPVSLKIDPPTPTFRADHPFIFAIRHDETGSLLFLGRMNAPKAGD